MCPPDHLRLCEARKRDNALVHAELSIKHHFWRAFRVTQYTVSEFLISHLHIPQLIINVQIHNFNKEV